MATRSPPSIWILTDGKAGDLQPLIGIAEAMDVVPDCRKVTPRAPFRWLMPHGPIDCKDRPDRPGSPIAPPFPDICLATGRRAVAYLRMVKRLSPATFTVLFKDPRTGRHGADLVVVQAHDALRGDHVMVVATAPNRLSSARLEALRLMPPPLLASLPRPRIAALVGGNSRHHRFEPSDIDRLMHGLQRRLDSSASLMITPSRRTPEPLRQALAALSNHPAAQIWDGSGENPFAAYIALADELVVTADSTNMIGDAAASGKPIQIFHPTGGHPKIDRFIAALEKIAVIGRFPDAPASGTYAPVNSTPDIAVAILDGWSRTRP
jgi:mitochondrial fission protein ELM1